jgi:soluble lytic murein transglycosylase-like protein
MTKFLLPYVIGLLVAASAIIGASEAKAAQVEVDPVLRERLAQNMAEIHEHIDRFDAQVWLQVSDQRLQRYLPKQDDRLKLLQLVYMEATRQQLNPNLVLAVMQIESAFNQFAISSVGAQGLMQVMPFWRLEIGRPQDNLTHVETNIRYGTVILAHYIEVARGDLVDALARYNGSRGRLKYPEKVIGAWRKTWRNQPWSELPLLRASCANYPLRACRYQ